MKRSRLLRQHEPQGRQHTQQRKPFDILEDQKMIGSMEDEHEDYPKDARSPEQQEHPDAEIACKIDCEGCEYELLALGRLEPEVMEHVSQVMVEYHAEEPPSETLEQLGFEVETEPGPNGVGWVRARRAA